MSPDLCLCLIPYLEHGNSSLQVQLSVRVPYVCVGTRLMYMPLEVGNTPTSDYGSENPITAFDASGPLPLWYEDQHDTASRVWFPRRPTKGDLKLVFTAYPGLDSRSGGGARIDLREDQGGLIGSLVAIIPRLEAFESGILLKTYMNWDLSRTPEGSKAAWTLGDGLSTRHVGTMGSVINTLFAVGPRLSSITRQIALPGSREELFGIYWMGDAPYDSASFLEKLSILFAGMATFFHDEDVLYKILIRRSTVRSYGGTSFARTFMFEYFPGCEFSLSDSTFLLAHEMVHNWPRLGPCVPSATPQSTSVSSLTAWPCDSDTTWFDEGIAVYYGTILPYRLGVCNASQFTDELNSHAQSYYTNPSINVSNQEAHERPFASFGVVRLPYYRGFMYLVTLDAEIRRASDGSRSLDDVVLELLARKNAGQPFGVDEFLSLVSKDQQTVTNNYYEMASGKRLQVPSTDSMSSAGLTLRRVDMPPFELGYKESREGNISDVVKGSRAAEAGLRVGDHVVETSDINWVAARLERNLKMRVRRSAENAKDIIFWPRARYTVEGYQWV